MIASIDWTDVLARAAVDATFVVVPLLGTGYIAWKKLWWMLGEHRPHTHREKAGPLQVDGINYPRGMK